MPSMEKPWGVGRTHCRPIGSAPWGAPGPRSTTRVSAVALDTRWDTRPHNRLPVLQLLICPNRTACVPRNLGEDRTDSPFPAGIRVIRFVAAESAESSTAPES